MALLIQKFGGTSVGSLDRIRVVADVIEKTARAGYQLVVVLSAMSGETAIDYVKWHGECPKIPMTENLICFSLQVSE